MPVIWNYITNVWQTESLVCACGYVYVCVCNRRDVNSANLEGPQRYNSCCCSVRIEHQIYLVITEAGPEGARRKPNNPLVLPPTDLYGHATWNAFAQGLWMGLGWHSSA